MAILLGMGMGMGMSILVRILNAFTTKSIEPPANHHLADERLAIKIAMKRCEANTASFSDEYVKALREIEDAR